MIEAAEFATPTQRRLHDHYEQIHLKFFPKPPVFPKLIVKSPSIPPPITATPPVDAEPQPVVPALGPIGMDQTKLRMRIIRRNVCRAFGISKDTLMSPRRLDAVVRPRHAYSYLVSLLTRASLPVIARSLGQDHTTIMHAIETTKKRVAKDEEFAARLRRLELTIRIELGETSRPRSCVARYVEHHRVMDHFMLGWMWAANLNEYAALLIWPCACECVEPKG
jgi:Bacterial dnaA protein helix-turn-helix